MMHAWSMQRMKFSLKALLVRLVHFKIFNCTLDFLIDIRSLQYHFKENHTCRNVQLWQLHTLWTAHFLHTFYATSLVSILFLYFEVLVNIVTAVNIVTLPLIPGTTMGAMATSLEARFSLEIGPPKWGSFKSSRRCTSKRRPPKPPSKTIFVSTSPGPL